MVCCPTAFCFSTWGAQASTSRGQSKVHSSSFPLGGAQVPLTCHGSQEEEGPWSIFSLRESMGKANLEMDQMDWLGVSARGAGGEEAFFESLRYLKDA